MSQTNSLLTGRWVMVALTASIVSWLEPGASADPGVLTVKVNQPGAKISPMLYGLMTEEINHSYDGGLYAELIQNRTFKDAPPPPPGPRRGIPSPMTTQPATPPAQPLHWSLVAAQESAGTFAVDTSDPVNSALGYSLRLDISGASAGQRVGVSNEGFWGIPVKPETEYRASFYARAGKGFKGPLSVSIEGNDGPNALASASVPEITDQWKRYSVTLKTGQVEVSTKNRFVISTTSNGTVWLSLVSLFPPTFNDRPNGNRIDLMQLLGEMHPAFLRFPGGNYLEGDYFNERFNWKETIGPIEQRPGHQCPWRYRSSDGLGLLEFLEWCEDLQMEPVLAVFAGYTLRGQRVAAGDELQPYVTEALEEIEYVTGSADTKWGQERVKDGHAAPFTLTYVEVGNEDQFDRQQGSYDARFTQFYDAIKQKHPTLQVIATARVQTRKPDVMDDHYYRPAVAMERDVHHYDNYDRSGPKIFVGEWASREPGNQRTITPSLYSALGDAAWLTGLERNSDLVVMSCYAPLLVNVNPGASQWMTDLIGYDAQRSFGSPSYYVQKMFSGNRGDVVLPIELTADEPPAPSTVATTGPTSRPTETLFATSSRDESTGDVIVKFVNARETAQQMKIELQGVTTVTSATGEELSGQPSDVNTIDEPMKVAPKPITLSDAAPTFAHEFPAHSVSVLRIKTK